MHPRRSSKANHPQDCPPLRHCRSPCPGVILPLHRSSTQPSIAQRGISHDRLFLQSCSHSLVVAPSLADQSSSLPTLASKTPSLPPTLSMICSQEAPRMQCSASSIWLQSTRRSVPIAKGLQQVRFSFDSTSAHLTVPALQTRSMLAKGRWITGYKHCASTWRQCWLRSSVGLFRVHRFVC